MRSAAPVAWTTAVGAADVAQSIDASWLKATPLAGFTPALRSGFQGAAVSAPVASKAMTGPTMAEAWVRVCPSEKIPVGGQADNLVAGTGAAPAPSSLAPAPGSGLSLWISSCRTEILDSICTCIWKDAVKEFYLRRLVAGEGDWRVYVTCSEADRARVPQPFSRVATPTAPCGPSRRRTRQPALRCSAPRSTRGSRPSRTRSGAPSTPSRMAALLASGARRPPFSARSSAPSSRPSPSGSLRCAPLPGPHHPTPPTIMYMSQSKEGSRLWREKASGRAWMRTVRVRLRLDG